MTQRVNIQYSINLDDLEKELTRLYERSANGTTNLSESLSRLPETMLSLETIEELVGLQQQALDIRAGLGDLQQIIAGFLSYRLQEVAAAAAENGVDEEEPTEDKEIADLQQQTQRVRQLMETLPTPEENEKEFTDVKEVLEQKIDEFKQATRA